MSREGIEPAVSVAVRAAIERNGSDLLAYFERRAEVRADAADLLGETMLHAWRRARALPLEDHVEQRMWLFGVARKVLANHHRTSRRRAALVTRLRDRLSGDAAGGATVPDPAEATVVRDAIDRLPPRLREVVMLVHWDGFTVAEVARLTGLNASTARGRYADARAALRELLGEVELDPPDAGRSRAIGPDRRQQSRAG